MNAGLRQALAAALLVFLGAACGRGDHEQQGQTPVEAAVMQKFSWGKCSVFECSEMYSASDVDCHQMGETLRGTPVYWCLVRYNDNQASTGACVNLAGTDLAMSGPVLQTQCDARVAKARVNRFFTEIHDALP
jgi:hypothetical protein